MVVIILMREESPCAGPYIWTPWRGFQPSEFLLHSVAMKASKTHIDYVCSYIHLRHPVRTMNAVVHTGLATKKNKRRSTENLPQRTVETLTVLVTSYSRNNHIDTCRHNLLSWQQQFVLLICPSRRTLSYRYWYYTSLCYGTTDGI